MTFSWFTKFNFTLTLGGRKILKFLHCFQWAKIYILPKYPLCTSAFRHAIIFSSSCSRMEYAKHIKNNQWKIVLQLCTIPILIKTTEQWIVAVVTYLFFHTIKHNLFILDLQSILIINLNKKHNLDEEFWIQVLIKMSSQKLPFYK